MQPGKTERRTVTESAPAQRTKANTTAFGNAASRPAECTHGRPITLTQANGEQASETASEWKTKANGVTKVSTATFNTINRVSSARLQLLLTVLCSQASGPSDSKDVTAFVRAPSRAPSTKALGLLVSLASANSHDCRSADSKSTKASKIMPFDLISLTCVRRADKYCRR